jgi:hypothetical protein
MRYSIIGALCILAAPAYALEAKDLHGTRRLVSSVTKDLETGQERNTLGAHPTGYITYGEDGRMMTVAVSDERPNVRDASNLTEDVRAKLQRSMWAYGGTYTLQGDAVVHKIDVSWNEFWTGTSMTREIQRRDDGRLVFTTKPQRGNQSGHMEVLTLVWEKAK